MMLNYPVSRLIALWMAHEGLPRHPKIVALTTGRAVFADLVATFTHLDPQSNWHNALRFNGAVTERYHELLSRRLITIVQDFNVEVARDRMEMVIKYNLMWQPRDTISYVVPLHPCTDLLREQFQVATEKLLGEAQEFMLKQPQIVLNFER